MTPFEIIVIVLLAIISVAVVYGVLFIRNAWVVSTATLRNEIQKCGAVLGYIRNGNEQIIQHLCDIQGCQLDIQQLLDKMHHNICADVAEKMVDRAFPIKEGEPLDEPFEPDHRLMKDIKCKLNGFAAAILDAECCTEEFVDFWAERICESANKHIKQTKIDWDKLSKEQQDEFLKRLICPDYDKPFDNPFIPSGATTWPPCYWGGPCTNPHRDCINCPKPNVSGGTWTTTSNKVEENKK